MKNVLFVSIAFPPKNDPECLQTAKYWKYLSQDPRLEFTILTSAMPTLFMPYDEMLSKFDQGYKKKIEIPLFENRYLNYAIRRVLPSHTLFPDSKHFFHRQWKKALSQLGHKPDVIYSRSNPLSSAIMAFKLKKKLGLPWMMHLSDPWVDSPAHVFTPPEKEKHARWEHRCFHAADRISFTSEKSLAFYQQKYPVLATRMVYLPNAYDPANVKDEAIDFGGKLRLVYTGGLTTERSLSSLIEALNNIASQNPDMIDRLEVLFAGPMDRASAQVVRENPFIKHLGPLSYTEAQRLVRSAHMLLTIDMKVNEPAKAMFFPSKLLDYFLANRMIIALTDSESTTASVLQGVNARIVEQSDSHSLMRCLEEALAEFDRRNADYFQLGNRPEKFDVSKQSHILANILHSL